MYFYVELACYQYCARQVNLYGIAFLYLETFFYVTHLGLKRRGNFGEPCVIIVELRLGQPIRVCTLPWNKGPQKSYFLKGK